MKRLFLTIVLIVSVMPREAPAEPKSVADPTGKALVVRSTPSPNSPLVQIDVVERSKVNKDNFVAQAVQTGLEHHRRIENRGRSGIGLAKSGNLPLQRLPRKHRRHADPVHRRNRRPIRRFPRITRPSHLHEGRQKVDQVTGLPANLSLPGNPRRRWPPWTRSRGRW